MGCASLRMHILTGNEDVPHQERECDSSGIHSLSRVPLHPDVLAILHQFTVQCKEKVVRTQVHYNNEVQSS